MCGRYYRRSDKQKIAEAFHIRNSDGVAVPPAKESPRGLALCPKNGPPVSVLVSVFIFMKRCPADHHYLSGCIWSGLRNPCHPN
jgi:hypothetical protein